MRSKKKVLLIDDESDFCFFVKNNLEQTEEFEVLTATNAVEGIKLARFEMPDLILLDIVMPKMEGSDVAAILLGNPKTKHIPLIFLTAVVNKDEIGFETIKEIGGQYFIAKPVDTESLVSCIRMILKEKEGYRMKEKTILTFLILFLILSLSPQLLFAQTVINRSGTIDLTQPDGVTLTVSKDGSLPNIPWFYD